MLPLFDGDGETPVQRIGINSPEMFAYWSAFRCGVEGQSRPGEEPDERVNQFIRDGYRLGRLFRPLPCMREKRR